MMLNESSLTWLIDKKTNTKGLIVEEVLFEGIMVLELKSY
jgi:hypothetical protein